MAGIFSKLFAKKSTTVLGIDIGLSSIKLVQLSRKDGRAVLDTYGELALGPYAGVEIGRATNLSPEKIGAALKDVMRESKVTTNNCGIAIPFNLSLIASMEMPSMPREQLAQMIPIEARKYIPVPISEVMLDWLIIPKATDAAGNFKDAAEPIKQADKLDVLLVAIHNEVLTRFQTIVSESGLNASFFEIEIFSAIRSILDQDVATQMIVDMGAATTKFYIVEQGMVRASHVVNRGAQDLTIALTKALDISMQNAEILKRDLSTQPEERKKEIEEICALTLEYIFSEGQRTLLSYQKRYNKDVPKAILVGGGARLDNILTLSEKHFQTAVMLGDPFGKTEAPAFLEDVLRKTGPEFAVAVGLALRKLQEIS